MKFMIFFVLMTAVPLFSQETENTLKNHSLELIPGGLQNEAHESKFNTIFTAHESVFVEVSGGSGLFSRAEPDAHIFSGGFTVNSGIKKHYLSFGMHVGYQGNALPKMTDIFKSRTISSTVLLGYRYVRKNVKVKMHVQPSSLIGILDNRSIPVTALGFGYQF